MVASDMAVDAPVAIRRGGVAYRGKRAIDVLLASLALALSAPLLAFIWLCVVLTSAGPAVYRQERLGMDRAPFTMFKFRTMRADTTDDVHRAYVERLLTEEVPPDGGERGLYKLRDDDRVTRVGALLRRSSLDELPQLVNVVRGEMSLVGPRPVLGWEAEHFDETESERFTVRPGVTGLAQVNGRSRLTMREQLRFDVEYARRQRLGLDLAVLARTIPALLRPEAR